MNKITSLILLLPFISACNNEVNTVSYTLPYYSGCDETLAKVESIFEKITQKKDYKLRIEVSKFDLNSYSNHEVKGVVKLISEGSWKTLDGGSPIEYLKLHANGISSDCMPNNFQEVLPENLISVYNEINKQSLVIPKISDDGKVILYFNDGHYKYLQPAK
ncbi:hypothetical protein [Marinomonas shanghaiensis]|uniref:hypothetical protein n=1 Tax=Marinomonas shanghaiensis TaxID=2202418 RepID=UPI003A8F5FF1